MYRCLNNLKSISAQECISLTQSIPLKNEIMKMKSKKRNTHEMKNYK